MKNESNIQRLSCFLILLTTLLINQVSSDYISDSLLSYSISTEALACERIENNTLIVAKISPDSGYFKLISNENFDFKGEPSNGSGGGTEEKSRRLQINTISSNSFKLITFPKTSTQFVIIDYANNMIYFYLYTIDYEKNTFTCNSTKTIKDVTLIYKFAFLSKDENYIIIGNTDNFYIVNFLASTIEPPTFTYKDLIGLSEDATIENIDCNEISDSNLLCLFNKKNDKIIQAFIVSIKGEKLFVDNNFYEAETINAIKVRYITDSNSFYFCIQDGTKFICNIGQYDYSTFALSKIAQKQEEALSNCQEGSIQMKEIKGIIFASCIKDKTQVLVSRMKYDSEKLLISNQSTPVLTSAINTVDIAIYDRYTLAFFISTSSAIYYGFFITTPECETFSTSIMNSETKSFKLNDLYNINSIMKNIYQFNIKFQTTSDPYLLVSQSQISIDEAYDLAQTSFQYKNPNETIGTYSAKYTIDNKQDVCIISFTVNSCNNEYAKYFNVFTKECQIELDQYTYVENSDEKKRIRICKYNCANTDNTDTSKDIFCNNTSITHKCYGSLFSSLTDKREFDLVIDTNPLEQDLYLNLTFDFIQLQTYEEKVNKIKTEMNNINYSTSTIELMNYICSFYSILSLTPDIDNTNKSDIEEIHTKIVDELIQKIITNEHINDDEIEYNLVASITLYHILRYSISLTTDQIKTISKLETILITYGKEKLTTIKESKYSYQKKDYANVLNAVSSLILNRVDIVGQEETNNNITLVTTEETREIKENIDNISFMITKFNQQQEEEEESNIKDHHYYNINSPKLTFISYPIDNLYEENTSQNGLIISTKNCNDKEKLLKQIEQLHFKVKICFPYDEIISDYTNAKYLSYIYYDNSYPFIANADSSKVSKSFSSLVLRDNNNNKINVEGLKNPFQFIIYRSESSFNECLYYNESENNLNSTDCTSEELNSFYVICSCNHLTDFSLSTFNPNPTIEIIPTNVPSQRRLVNSFEPFDNLTGKNAVAFYILLAFFIAFLIGTVFTLRFDIIYEKDCLLKIENINIMESCSYSEEVLIEVNCAEVEINKQTQFMNDVKGVELVNIDTVNLSTLNNKNNANILYSRNVNVVTKKNSCCNFFKGVFIRFFRKQYFICFFFFNSPSENNPSNITKTNYLICFICKLIVIMLICSFFTECDSEIALNQKKLITVVDINVAIISLIIVEIPYMILKLLLNKTKISSCTQNSIQRYKLSTICRYVMIYLIIISIIAFCIINTQWILLDSHNKGMLCKIWVDYIIAIIGDLLIFQIIILALKTIVFVILIKCGEQSAVGTCLKCLVTTIPYIFSLEE